MVPALHPKEIALQRYQTFELHPIWESSSVPMFLSSFRRCTWLYAGLYNRKIKQFLWCFSSLLLQDDKLQPIYHIEKDKHEGKEQPSIVINAIRINEVETNCSRFALWSSGIGQRSLLYVGGGLSLCFRSFAQM